MANKISARRAFISLIATGMLLLAACSGNGPNPGEWKTYGGENGQRFSRLSQINPGNVAQLTQAWRFDAGAQGGLQTSPLVIDNILYGYGADQSAFALDAATGKLLWRFNSGLTSGQPVRGMSYWSDRTGRSLFVSSLNFVYALDPKTGKPVQSFGQGGRIDLREGLDRDPDDVAVFATTPGVVYNDLLIMGFRTSENAPAAPGTIRAYDVRTGKIRWAFHTIPYPGEKGHETWPADAYRTAGASNNWAGMAVDEKRGILFVPTGSPVFDFFGGDRKGDNLFSNSLVALNAANGKRLWHFQAVHHDLWDRDFPSPPTLVTVRHEGRMVDAVAQTSKQGFIFVLDRATGKSLFPIEERAVPASDVPCEFTSPTQPFPVLPEPFARQRLTRDMLTRRTPGAHAAALAKFRTMRSEGQFVPFSTERDTVIFPGFDGGAEWGGSAFDPRHGILYVNANDVPWYTRLVRNVQSPAGDVGAQVYQANCSACHGPDRKGSPPEIPALVGVGSRLFPHEIRMVIANGRGRMPGFPQVAGAQLAALTAFLVNNGKSPPSGGGGREVAAIGQAAKPAPYTIGGYNKFIDQDGYPAVTPPWGTLNAIDLNSGKYLWRVPLGQYPELAAKGMGNTGSENYGGPVVTASGLLFIGATIYDRKFRAFDSRTGKLLWETQLPYAGTATPVTYSVNGRQFLVIATSGSRNPAGPQGAAYVAFALPKSR
ncbi:outer membrane protein assembly factor BamB family protein [Sphingobium cupriresistens]|uniref:outer membrane protein assembly factor BamB family protein n=1 Tax=Sphingobium cupriresistens TaxID=1132417 RepID=UPI0009E80319|nr:PQQ-binding-like beta-propeller repeat protein [Sphingobium cupriresistens]